MNPGRELDAIIAKEIMGWQQNPKDKSLWCDSKEPNAYWPLSLFSKNDVAALSAVDRFHERGLGLVEIHAGRPFNRPSQKVQWDCLVYTTDGKEIIATSEFQESRPLAICKALLKAVGVEIP